MASTPPERPVVLVSNRGPVSFQPGPDGELESKRGAGGLISGVGPLMSDIGATWLASAISEGDREAAGSGVVEADGYRVHLLAVDPDVYRLAYDVVSNQVLWFAHHGLWDLTREPVFDSSWPEAWDAYRTLNRSFAEAVAQDAPEGALVLVQDYHLCLVPAQLAEQRPDVRIVHFSHTPFAPPVWLSPLPEASALELVAGMAASQACGFHTSRWADDFHASSLHLSGRASRTFVSPLGSDPEDIRAAAASQACAASLHELEELVGDRQVIGRVDRVELSKNLIRGFLAYGELLEAHPEHRERVVFVAGAYASRGGVEAYARYRAEIEAVVEKVNARWGTPGWQPIVLQVEDDFPRSVALLRRADVLLVNPIRDGLNLVASEGALVNERHAVLALSRGAGAWEQLHRGALAVPPFDVSGTAEVLHEALTMEPAERERRASLLRSLAEERTPADWLHDQRVAGG